jgi:predicted ATPase/DNA-binding CsgD family transcriptional regulator
MGGTGSGQAAGLQGFVPALTTFVGRAEDVGKVSALLEGYRLVTVTGPGGVGKSRLAAEVARGLAAGFADGIRLVELAAVQDPALVPGAVIAALGAQQVPGAPAIEALAAVLGRQQLLLVLDNCEHVLAAVAELCVGVLPAADDVRVLATSREPIGVAGETRYRLGPLAVPGPDATGDVAGFAAVTLFIDRASQADRAFVMDDETGPLVRRLVARLDGMPLAIELAAARVEALGLGQLLGRLDDRLALLTSADRTAAARQRSLAATVDWSYQLLSDQDRDVFRRLAVFPGPFTLEAAGTVAGADAGLAVLRLVDCSLLAPPRPGPDGRARYVMLETLRAFGVGRLAETDGEGPDAEAALARHALAVAEQASTDLQASGSEIQAARWLEAEDAAIQHAVSWALHHDPASALRMAIAVAPWWAQTGREDAGYKLLSAAAGQAAQDDDAWAEAQYWLGPLADGKGDMARSHDHYTAARDALASGPPSPLLCRARAGRAESLMMLGQLREAAGEADQALAMARELGDPVGEAQALYCLAWTAMYLGDYENCLAWLEQNREKDPARLPGHWIRALSHARAIALMETGQLAEARQECLRGLALAQAGDIPREAEFLGALADIDLREGRADDSSAHLRDAIGLAARVTGAVFMQLNCLDMCARLCAMTGRPASAVTMWAASDARLQEFGIPYPPAMIKDRHEPLQQASRTLGTAKTRAAEERGATMGLAAAMEFAALLAADPQQPLRPLGLTQLSPREQELVTLVARGSTDAQIAAQLYISISTVRSHLDRIRDKTSCRRRADLTRLALQAGLV